MILIAEDNVLQTILLRHVLQKDLKIPESMVKYVQDGQQALDAI